MAPSYVFAVSILCLYVRFCVCFDQSDRISDLRLCVDPECKGVISYARTLLKYSGDHPKILSFERNKEVKVFSKSAGTKPDLWGGEINGRRGYFPRTFVQEYKVFVKNPLQIVPTESESFPATVEEQKSNNTYGVGDEPTKVENVVHSVEPHHEITSSNKTTANSEIEDKKREEKSPLTRRLLSLDDQESMSVQETSEQIPSPPVPLIDLPIQIKTDGVTEAEDHDEEPITKPSVTKSYILVEGTKVEVDVDQDETPDLVTVQQTRTPGTPIGFDSVAASDVKQVPATAPTPSTTAVATAENQGEDTVKSSNKDEISPTSSSSSEHGAEVTEGTGEVQYATDLVKPEDEVSSPKTADAWFEDTATASTNEEMKEEAVNSGSSLDERGEVAEKEDEKEFKEKEVEVASESRGIFSQFFNGETDDDDKVNVSDVGSFNGNAADEPAQKVDPEDSDVGGEKDNVDEGEDDAAVDEEGDDNDDYNGIGDDGDDDGDNDDENEQAVDENDVQNGTEAVAMETVDTETVAMESVGTETVAREIVGMETVATETVAMETVAMEVVAMEAVVKETVAKESVGMETVVTEAVVRETVAMGTVTGPTLNIIEADERNETDVMVDADVEWQLNSNDHDRSDVEVDSNMKRTDAVLPDSVKRNECEDAEVDTVTPFGVDDSGDDGHCVDCESHVTDVPVDVRVEGKLPEDGDGGGSESWNERWNRLDVKETAKPYVEFIGAYTQMIIDVLPEPLYVMLLDLQERAVSPRVVVFTFLVGIFTFFIGFTYFVLCYKIKGSGTFLAAKLSSLDQKLFTAMTERNCLRETVSASERKIESLLDDWQSANNDAQTFRRELKASRSDNLRLQKALDNLESELHQQKEAVSEMNSGAKDTVQANLRLKQELEETLLEVASLQEQNANLLADAMSSETTKDALELQLANQNEELEQLRSGNEQLLKEAADWDATVKALERQIAALTQENAEMKGALASKKTELQALEELVSQMKPEGEDDGDMLAKVLDVAHLKAELKSMAAEKDTLQSKLKYEAAVKEQLEEQLFAGAADVDKMRKELSVALNAKEDAEKRLQVLSSYFKEKEMELQMELGLQQAKRQQTQESAVTSTQKAALYEQEVELYKSQIDGLKKEIEDQERSFKMQVAEHEKKAHNNWLAARNAERRLEEMKRESSMLRNKLTSMDQEKESMTRSNPDGTTLQTNSSSRFYGVNGESIPSNSPNPGSLPGLPADLPPLPPPSSGPSSLYHEPIDFRRMPHQPFLPADRPLPPPPHFLMNHMPPPPMHPFADRGPGGPMPMFPGPPPHLYDRGMPSPPPDYRFGPPPPPPLYPIPRRRSPPTQFESARRSPSPSRGGRGSPFDPRVAGGPGSRTPVPESSMPLPSRQWLPNIDARREPVVPSSRHDLIHDPRTSSPLTSELNKPTHGSRNSAV